MRLHVSLRSVALLAALFILRSPLPGHAEGGTWPPVGQLGGGLPQSVAVYGGYAYIAAGGAFTVVDVSDPSQPHQVGYYDTPGYAAGVAVVGAYAYVADGDGGLRVIDISDPAAPTELASCDTPGYARGVAVVGACAYVADGDGGLRVIDISNPATPTEVGFCETQGSARGVAVEADYAYVVTLMDGLRVIDISDPAAATEVASCDTPILGYGVAVEGSYAYVVTFMDGLQVIDISNPATPTEVGFKPGWYCGVTLAGGYAYAAGGYRGHLTVFDVSNPAAPTAVGSCGTPGDGNGVAVAGGHAYVADGEGGLRVISISEPSAPTEVGFCGTYGSARGVAVIGAHAYVAGGYWIGFRVMDISDPSAPTEVGFCETQGSAHGVAAEGSYAYVTDTTWTGLCKVRASDPAAPTEVGYCETPGTAYGVAVVGTYAYIADGSYGLRVIDVSRLGWDPEPEVGFCETPGTAYGVAVAGSYAYIADGEAGLRAIDISDPAAPTEVGSCDTPGTASGVATAGGYAYIADGDGGLRVIDISDPGALTEVGSCDTPGTASGVAVAGSCAYIADGDGGLRVIDISDPAAPAESAFWDTPGYARSVAVAGGCAYLADSEWGLLVFGSLLVADAGPDKAIAAGGSATLEGSASGGLPPFTFAWTPTTGLDDPTAAQPVASPAETTTYTLTVTDSLAQSDTDTVTVVLAPVADFTAAPTIGVVPLSVTFTDASTNEPTFWSWEFGDGSTAAAQHPSHDYVEVGAYTVLLTAGNGAGADTRCKEQYILVTFPDVPFEPEEYWALRQILACVDAGIVVGYPDGAYHPDLTVDRAQMAVYISRALAGGDENVPEFTGTPTFPDVDAENWALEYVEYAVSQNVVAGYDDGSYHPEYEVTRDQMAVYVARAMVAPTGEAGLADYVPADPRNFPDVPTDHWAYTHVEYCVEHGVVSGYDDGNYRPDTVVTRDQMAVYVARAFLPFSFFEDFSPSAFDASDYYIQGTNIGLGTGPYEGAFVLTPYLGIDWDGSGGGTHENQTGRIFRDERVVIDSFVTEFDFRIGGSIHPAGGADGMTFAFTDDYTYPAWHGGAHDYWFSGWEREFEAVGWAVEIDTHYEWDAFDPPYRHIALRTPDVHAGHIAVAEIANPRDLDWTDGVSVWHHMRIEFESGAVTVVYDGAPVLAAAIPDFTPFEGHFGLTAATGGMGDWHIVDNFTVTALRAALVPHVGPVDGAS